MQDKYVLIQHGAYEATLRLFDIPSGDMVGMLSIRDPEREINIKLEPDDLVNIKLSVVDYCNEKEI